MSFRSRSCVVDAIDPDGSLPDDQLNQDRRHFTLRPCPDGMYAGEFRLTGAAGAQLAALLQPLTRPRIESCTDADGRTVQLVDERTYGQRAHDALEWRPPRWLDRERKPLVNSRITAHLASLRKKRQPNTRADEPPPGKGPSTVELGADGYDGR